MYLVNRREVHLCRKSSYVDFQHGKIQVNLNLPQVMETQRRSRGVALLFL